ncbi:MAG: hypothetical protein AAF447_14870, partial [Myxococcota bacterium]
MRRALLLLFVVAACGEATPRPRVTSQASTPPHAAGAPRGAQAAGPGTPRLQDVQETPPPVPPSPP